VWRSVAKDTTDAWGSTSSSVKITKAVPAKAKATVVATDRTGKKVSVGATVTAKVGKKYVPAKGVKVQMQVKAGRKWKTVKTARTTSKGRVAFKVNAKKKATYRLVVVKQQTVKATTSKTFRR